MRPRMTAGLVLLVMALAGCGLLPERPAEANDCSWLERQTGSGAAPALDLVVLIDRTASARAKGTRLTPDWYERLFGKDADPDANGVIRFARRPLPTPARIRVAAFDGEGARVSWQRQQIDLPRMDGAGRHQQKFVTHAIGCLRRTIEEATLSAPVARGTDVLAAMGAGRAGMAGGAARHEMIVATDGLSTQGCADLRRTVMREQSLIGGIVRGCDAQRAVPDLRGWTVRLTGLGVPGAGWAVPRTGQLAWLTGLWSALCVAAVRDPDHCQADSDAPAQGKRDGAAGADDPAIDFGPPDRPADPVRTLSFPGDVLFGTDSAHLSMSGRNLLDRFVTQVRPLRPEWIEVRGYTDSRRGAGYNLGLSRRRAASVRDALVTAGLSHVEAKGLGEAEPACDENAGNRDAARACNRRVRISYKVRG